MHHYSFWLTSWSSLVYFFQIIPIHGCWIQLALSQYSHHKSFWHVAKRYVTATRQCSGSFWCYFTWFWPYIMPHCLFSIYRATNGFFHILNALELGCPIHLANCSKQHSVFWRLIKSFPPALPKFDNILLSSSALYLSSENSGKWDKSTIPATSVICSSPTGCNWLIAGRRGVLQGQEDMWWQIRILVSHEFVMSFILSSSMHFGPCEHVNYS